MSQAQRCRCCGEPFVPRSQNPTQSYCARRACQRARKREWQRAKRAADPDYRANDQAARRTWAQAHPEYCRAYHPEYVQRNPRAQAGRNAVVRHHEPHGNPRLSGLGHRRPAPRGAPSFLSRQLRQRAVENEYGVQIESGTACPGTHPPPASGSHRSRAIRSNRGDASGPHRALCRCSLSQRRCHPPSAKPIPCHHALTASPHG